MIFIVVKCAIRPEVADQWLTRVACDPQKLQLPRRWPEQCSGPSAHCLRNPHCFPGFV
jgi:hypothetical protein